MAEKLQANRPAPSRWWGRLFNTSLNLYRRTIKRIYPIHAATHWVISHTVIPLLEQSRRFKTVKDDPFWFRLELLLRRHETETVRQIQQILKPGMTVLDIGAHVGYYSRIFGELVGRSGCVIAFEPHPRTYQTLRVNTKRQHHIQLHQVAASDKAGEAKLFDYLLMSASGSLHYDESLADLQRAQATEYAVAPRNSERFEAQQYHVETVVLDDHLVGLGVRQVDFIKMDIEGAEVMALRGLSKTIKRSDNLRLIMEFNPQALYAFDHDPAKVIAEVMAMGFARVQYIDTNATLIDITHDDAKIAELVETLSATMQVVNLLFSKANTDE